MCPANAKINRIKNGITYCIGEYSGDYIIDWKKNTITRVLGGESIYKIVKEANSNIYRSIITARYMPSDLNINNKGYYEFKMFSSQSKDYVRFMNRDTKTYNREFIDLFCWDELEKENVLSSPSIKSK